jgi:glycosyltransferase involved in cell wall biosynthesis
MKKKICVISLSKISHDGRVLRQIRYLSKKYDLIVIGYGPSQKLEDKIDNIKCYEIWMPKNKLLYQMVKIFVRLIQIPFFPKTHPVYKIALNAHCDAYHANNWDALPFAALAGNMNEAKVVLDLHESYDSLYWGIATPIIKSILKKYSLEVDASTTVVQQLVEQYQEFNLEPVIIRNVPSLPKSTIKFYKTHKEKIKLVHHGVATPTRSTDLMIRILALADHHYELHLVFINHKSCYVAKLRKLANKIAPGRVFFHPPFRPDEIIEEINRYDIGFFPLPPKNFNYLIALPNKLFEFIAAGLAVFIGPSPSMADIVREYQCGLISPSFTPQAFAEILNNTSIEDWDRMKKASLKASENLNANVEMKKLYDLYESLLKE